MMSPRVEFAYNALWFAHPVLQAAVAVVMFRRGVYRKFRVFFAYALAQVLIFAIVFPASKVSYELWFDTYWITAALNLPLGFAVIHEVFVDVFRPYHTLKDLGTVLFKWAGLVMLMVAAVVAAASSASEAGPLVQAVLTVQRCVRVIQCGLVLFLLLFARFLGVSRKQQSYGIALGFGAFAGVELMCAALRASASISELSSSFVIMVAYDLAIVNWFGYMWVKATPRKTAETLLTSQRWEESLTDLQYPVAEDSLIPMFEGMVDQALSRKEDDAFDEAASHPAGGKHTSD